MRCECEREAEHCRKLCTEQARSQNPHGHLQAGTGVGADGLVRLHRLEVVQQFDNVLRKALRCGRRVTPQCERRALVRARRAADGKIDAPRMERLQRPELLGDHKRRVVRKHHPACADTDRARSRGDMADNHGGRSTRNPRHVVMLGQPVAMKS